MRRDARSEDRGVRGPAECGGVGEQGGEGELGRADHQQVGPEARAA